MRILRRRGSEAQPRSSWWKREGHFDYRPELDGVRAFAVLAVMLLHSANFFPGGRHFAGGFLGVDVFFVLSGYLITTLLYREFKGGGRIKLGGFYMRRALRLLPALFVMLVLGAVVVAYIGGNRGGRSYPVSALLTLGYVANWFQARHTLGVLSHTWSLSIEEQYYLIWPAVMILGIRFIKSTRTMAYIVLAGALGVAVLRYAVFQAGHPAYAALTTFTRSDGVLIGSALALFLAEPSPRFERVLKATWAGLLGVAAVVAVASRVQWNSPSLYKGGLLIVNVGTALLIGHLAVGGATLPKRFLALPPLAMIGRISYGLYLFHVPINYLIHAPPLAWTGSSSVVAVFAATFVFAAISFVLIERPALRLKKRFGSISDDLPEGQARLVAAG